MDDRLPEFVVYINTIITETLDPLQFTYRPNRSTDDAIALALHTVLTHLDKKNTYVFIDYSSAFNTIVPTKLITKLRTLEVNISLVKMLEKTGRRVSISTVK